jgi:phytoene dehydrogenase-like protein
VLVLEEQDHVGGAVTSASDVHPGYVHDTFSSFYPLAAASPVFARLALEDHGLRWSRSPAALGTPFADGQWAVLHASAEDTAAALERDHPGDGAAWLELCGTWRRLHPHIVGALVTPFPPVRHGLGALVRLSPRSGLELVRTLLAPVRSLAEDAFGGRAGRMLLGGNAAHADIPVDAAGSGFIGWLLAMLGQHVGFPVPVGGAGALSEALASRLRAAGGSIRLGARVERVEVVGGRAAAVRTADGGRVAARRAVVADVTAPALYGELVGWDVLPSRLRRAMRRFAWDPGTVKVDWALDGAVPWLAPPPAVPGTVHVAESFDELALAGAQIAAGAVPATPFLLVGQMAACDATRAPAGGESVWAYTHVPHEVRGDAGDGSLSGAWDADDLERMADRMQARLERYAPGFGERVLARRVLGPAEMEHRDANLRGGALNGGTANLHQQLVLRPVPGLGRAETPVPGLYLASASAHPGGGVHGACGSNAARAALAHDRVRRLVPPPLRRAPAGVEPGTGR